MTDDLPATSKWLRTVGDEHPVVADRMAEAIQDGLMAIGPGPEHTGLRMRVVVKTLAMLMATFEDRHPGAADEPVRDILDNLGAATRAEMDRFRRAVRKDARQRAAGGADVGH